MIALTEHSKIYIVAHAAALKQVLAAEYNLWNLLKQMFLGQRIL